MTIASHSDPPPAAKSSLAACAPWCEQAESALNAQISVEQTIAHIYESMSAFFGRDNVALPGLTKYFAEEADSERGHARKIIAYLNERGGVVKLGQIEAPPASEVFSADTKKADALSAMELSLALEKLNYEKLVQLDKLATGACKRAALMVHAHATSLSVTLLQTSATST